MQGSQNRRVWLALAYVVRDSPSAGRAERRDVNHLVGCRENQQSPGRCDTRFYCRNKLGF